MAASPKTSLARNHTRMFDPSQKCAYHSDSAKLGFPASPARISPTQPKDRAVHTTPARRTYRTHALARLQSFGLPNPTPPNEPHLPSYHPRSLPSAPPTPCTYLLSVAFCTGPPPSPLRSWLSNTQWLPPVAVSTSFHHLSPTSLRPAMFLR